MNGSTTPVLKAPRGGQTDETTAAAAQLGNFCHPIPILIWFDLGFSINTPIRIQCDQIKLD